MYDYVVVGGGSAGCALTARLSENENARILLIEAGPPDRNPDIHRPVCFYKMTSGPLTWGYETAPSPQRNGHVMALPQARVLGGGSSINAMVFTRGSPKDYDEWASEEGCDGWAFKDVLPYFRRAEGNNRLADDYHGTKGPLSASDQISPHPLSRAFVRAAQEAGLPYNADFNGAAQEGAGIYQVTQRDGKRSSTAVGYLHPAMKRGNIDLITDAEVHRILIENGRAIGVAYFARGQMHEARAEQEVIICSGAIGSPKLLLHSGIGPADELKAVDIDPTHDLPGVGKNLQDHIDVYSMHELNGPHSYDGHKRVSKMLWAGLEYMLFGSGPVTSNLAEAGGFWYADADERSPDIQFHFLPGAGLEEGVPPVPSGYGCTINSCHLRPRSRGSVTLRSSDSIRTIGLRPMMSRCPFAASKRPVRSRANRLWQPSSAGNTCLARRSKPKKISKPMPCVSARPTTTRSARARWAWTRWRSSIRNAGFAAWMVFGSPIARSCRG